MRCSRRVLISREPARDLDPRVEAQLVEDVVDVVVHGSLRDEETGRDLAIAQTAGQQPRDLAFAPAERDPGLGGNSDRLRFRSRGVDGPLARHAGKLAYAAFGELEPGADHEVFDG